MNAFADISEIHEKKEMTCPHCNSERAVCMASISSMRLGIVERLVYCNNENHDNCPIFLAKVLRER